jgi:hypothetical protein
VIVVRREHLVKAGIVWLTVVPTVRTGPVVGGLMIVKVGIVVIITTSVRMVRTALRVCVGRHVKVGIVLIINAMRSREISEMFVGMREKTVRAGIVLVASANKVRMA